MVAKLNIVVVEDNEDLRTLTCQVLAGEGHRVKGLACAEELEDVAGGETADIFLLDINLPGEDGLSLSQRIRKAHPQVGIVMVTARTDIDDKVVGYESGADHYITKPVVFEELTAIIRSYARKLHSANPDQDKHAQKLVLDMLDVTGVSGTTRLTANEAMLLKAFSRAPSGRLETWQIAEMLSVELDETMRNSIKVRIARLRKKLVDVGADGLVIESIRSIGYQLLIRVEVI